MRRILRKTPTARGNRSKSILVIFSLVTLIAACLIMAGRELYEYAAARAEYSGLDEQLISQSKDLPDTNPVDVDIGDADDEDTATEEIWWPELEIDFDAYAAINPDFVGILYFPLFEMRYPVALSQDNLEYLTTTFEGQTNASGCIFMDYQNNRRFTDRSTYLYGHNMRDGSMFGCLKRLIREPQLCEDGPKFYVYTPDYILEYRMYAVELAPANERLSNIYTDKQYDEYMETISGRASFCDTDMDISDRPDMLTLYTCWGTDYKYKLLVHGLQTHRKELHPIILYPPRTKNIR